LDDGDHHTTYFKGKVNSEFKQKNGLKT